MIERTGSSWNYQSITSTGSTRTHKTASRRNERHSGWHDCRKTLSSVLSCVSEEPEVETILNSEISR